MLTCFIYEYQLAYSTSLELNICSLKNKVAEQMEVGKWQRPTFNKGIISSVSLPNVPGYVSPLNRQSVPPPAPPPAPPVPGPQSTRSSLTQAKIQDEAPGNRERKFRPSWVIGTLSLARADSAKIEFQNMPKCPFPHRLYEWIRKGEGSRVGP